jgi:hypothetical protein
VPLLLLLCHLLLVAVLLLMLMHCRLLRLQCPLLRSWVQTDALPVGRLAEQRHSIISNNVATVWSPARRHADHTAQPLQYPATLQ